MGWTLGAALAEGYRLGGLGQGSSGGGTWGAYTLLLSAAAASAWLLYLAVAMWQQQRQRVPGSGRLGVALSLPGWGMWGGLWRAAWLPTPLRGLGSRLPFKGSGPNLIQLSIDSSPPSSDRSSLATGRTLTDLVPGGSPFPTTRALGGGWVASHGPNGAAAGSTGSAAGLPAGGAAAGEWPRGLPWAAPAGAGALEGPAGAAAAGVGQGAAYATSRLARSHPSRRSLTTSPEGGAQ